MKFVPFAVAALIVGASVSIVGGLDPRAGWLLAVVVVLSALLAYPHAREGLSELAGMIGK